MTATQGPQYEEMFQRNIGFVSPKEQQTLRETPIFICGVGGMGGSCLLNLVRSGCEDLAISDIDQFEASNINRQLFSGLDALGKDKAEEAIRQIKNINPNCRVENVGKDWLQKLDQILSTRKLVVNGTDDLKASILLYRKAKQHQATVVDAYTSPLPSVYVVSPDDPRPEERLRYPTVGKQISEISKEIENVCKLKEAAFVIAASSSIKHIDFSIAQDVIAGLKPRMSFAPMVIGTGVLMAYQTVAVALKRKYRTDQIGFFVQPWSGRAERPMPFPLHQLKVKAVELYLRRLMK